jgi:hypothetical protein
MDENQKALADRVRERRLAKPRATQQAVGYAAGVSLGVVSNFERYITFPQPSNLRHILQAVGLEGEVTDEQIATMAGDSQRLDECPACGRVIWPETYELVFDVLGAFMDTMDRSERKAFQRWVTSPVRDQARPWLCD